MSLLYDQRLLAERGQPAGSSLVDLNDRFGSEVDSLAYLRLTAALGLLPDN